MTRSGCLASVALYNTRRGKNAVRRLDGLFRADAAYATPALYDRLDEAG